MKKKRSMTIMDLIGLGPKKGFAVKTHLDQWYCVDDRPHSVHFSYTKSGCKKFPMVLIADRFDYIVKVTVNYIDRENYVIEERF